MNYRAATEDLFDTLCFLGFDTRDIGEIMVEIEFGLLFTGLPYVITPYTHEMLEI